MTTALEVKNLTKIFPAKVAVSDISFSIEQGQIVGFLGPNGAGKTTTIRMLTCFMPATHGQASVMGYDYAETRNHLKSVSIREAMVKVVVTVEPDTEIQAAGRIMLDKKIGCLPVVQDKRLVGMVTETDILRCFITHYEDCVAVDQE